MRNDKGEFASISQKAGKSEIVVEEEQFAVVDGLQRGAT